MLMLEKRQFGLYIRAIAVLVAISFVMDTTVWAIDLSNRLNLRPPFIDRERLENVKKNYQDKPISEIRKKLVSILQDRKITIDRIELFNEEELSQLVELIKILPSEHVQRVLKVKIGGLHPANLLVGIFGITIGGAFYDKKKEIYASRLSFVSTYLHELGHSVEFNTLQPHLRSEYRQLSWKRLPRGIAWFLCIVTINFLPILMVVILPRLLPWLSGQPFNFKLFAIGYFLSVKLGLSLRGLVPLPPTIEKDNWSWKYLSEKGFVSSYARKDVREDFAETYERYVMNGDEFRADTKEDNILRQKYDFLKTEVFDGREYAKDGNKIIIKADSTTFSYDTGLDSKVVFGKSERDINAITKESIPPRNSL